MPPQFYHYDTVIAWYTIKRPNYRFYPEVRLELPPGLWAQYPGQSQRRKPLITRREGKNMFIFFCHGQKNNETRLGKHTQMHSMRTTSNAMRTQSRKSWPKFGIPSQNPKTHCQIRSLHTPSSHAPRYTPAYRSMFCRIFISGKSMRIT